MDSTITLTNQNNLFLSAVEKVISITPTSLIVDVASKRLMVQGNGLEIQRLDNENQILIVTGLVTCIKFAEPKKTIMKRLFK